LSEKALRLYPLPARELDPTTIHNHLPIIHTTGERSRAPEEKTRPYVVANMVSSADGRAAIAGRASGIGSKADRLVMRNLRAGVDAVMVGASTLRAERLSLGLDETSDGPQPLAVVLTASGDVPLDANLVSREDQRVLVISTEATRSALAERLAGRSEVLGVPATPDGYPDPAEALRVLRTQYAVERLLVEGGPSLNRALISGGLVDELFLTVAPKLFGAGPTDATTIIAGALPAPVSLRLLSVHLVADELFLRYALNSPNA
jgi:riboflavin-specific deaminase-like protein